jgi:hypothetical protein
MQDQGKKQDSGIQNIFEHTTTARLHFIYPTLVHFQSYISATETQKLLEMGISCANNFPESKQSAIFLNLQSLAYHLDINDHKDDFLEKVRTLLDNKNSTSSDFDAAVTDFLTQIKPAFLAHFADRTISLFTQASENIEYPVFTHKFTSNVIDSLKQYGKTINAHYNEPLAKTLTEKIKPNEPLNRHAEYAIHKTLQTFNIMLPALSEEERGDMITQIIDKFQNTPCFKTAKHYEDVKAAARKMSTPLF